MSCCSTFRDLESCESKICCQTKGFCDNFSCCPLPCMTKNVLRKIVILIGVLYLIISLLPVSYYITHNIIPKVLLQDPSDLKDLQQLSTLSVGILIALLINFILNLVFLMGVEVKLARLSFLLLWIGIAILCKILCSVGLIWLTFTGLGKVASTMLERQKSQAANVHGDLPTNTNMTSNYVFLGFVFLVISSVVITFCVYSIVMIIRMYKRRIKNQKKSTEHVELNRNENIIEANELLTQENISTSIAFSPEPDANINPKCSEFCGVCCCLVFEDFPGCAEMCLAAIRGKTTKYCKCSYGKSCTHLSLHSTVKLIANVSLTISILAIVLYISSALNSMTTFMLPVFTILHLIFIGLLIMGAMKQKRSYLLPWMIFSWISWLSLLPCIFGSFSSTKEWKVTFETSWVIACVSTYLAFNFMFWIFVKKFYVSLIHDSHKKSLEKKKQQVQKRNIQGERKKTTSECSSIMSYHNPLPQILVYDSEENVDDIRKPTSTEEDHPLEPIIESDPLDHSSSQSASNNKLKITAEVAVAAIAMKRSNDQASPNRTRNAEEMSHMKTQGKKTDLSKLKPDHEQKGPGAIHVPGLPKASNLASPKQHLSPRDKHGGRNLDGKKMNKGHGKGMKGGGRHGGMDRFDRSVARNNNFEKSDSKEGELFDFVVDVGGILDEQFDQYNDDKDEFSFRRDSKDSGDGGHGGSRKGRRQRSGSATAFLMVAESGSPERSKDKKSELARNRNIHARSATNLTGSGMNYYNDYSSSGPARKKSSLFSEQGVSNTSSTKRQTKKDASYQKMKMPKSRTRR